MLTLKPQCITINHTEEATFIWWWVGLVFLIWRGRCAFNTELSQDNMLKFCTTTPSQPLPNYAWDLVQSMSEHCWKWKEKMTFMSKIFPNLIQSRFGVECGGHHPGKLCTPLRGTLGGTAIPVGGRPKNFLMPSGVDEPNPCAKGTKWLAGHLQSIACTIQALCKQVQGN